jgi:ATP-dependent RNA helicase DeaD
MKKESTDATATPTGFTNLGLDPRLLESLTALGYEEPTPIQRESIPPLLAGRDMIGQAATGTGKTAAFALPVLQRVLLRGEKRPQPSALVLVPTRELAMQVSEAIHRYGRSLGTSVLPVFGGQSFDIQARGLTRGVDVIVATPGRALDHIRRGTLKLATIADVILDEADEMLDMGFAEDIEAILGGTPTGRQTVLFSATLPPRIAGMAKRHLTDPVRIEIGRETLKKGEVPKVRQTAYLVPRPNKLAALARILDIEQPTSALVFCRTRNEVDELAETLTARGYRAEALHGGMDQHQRTRVIKKLKAGAADLVIATDVAARGLDIDQLSHVFNFNMPSAPEAYVHRIGRVGRAGREGVAITLAEPREHRMLKSIEHATKQKIEIAQVPSQADLRARRMELTRAAVREALLEDQFDAFRAVVESLSDEFDVMNIALAAVKLAHQANNADTDEAEEEIPPVAIGGDDRADRKRGGLPPHAPKGGKFRKDAAPRGGGGGGGGGGNNRSDGAMARLFIGAGRQAGIRPQDLVGAIAGEAGLVGREVGAIEIADHFSFVEVPESRADQVIAALRATQIRGKKVTVRRDRHE